MTAIQYTIRGVPKELDERLRQEARERGESLNTLVVETLAQAKLPSSEPRHDLDWFIGTSPTDDDQSMADALSWLDRLPADFT